MPFARLIFYPEQIRANTLRAIEMAGGPERLMAAYENP